jgi:predicted nucleic acid-binding protein
MTFTSVEFCDTNVFVYAHERSLDPRRTVARELVERLWAARSGAVSIQVMQELFVVLSAKGQRPLPAVDARRVVAELSTWRVFEPMADDVIEAIDNSQRWQVSFWDAMLLTGANKLGARVLWSEDLNHGQTYGQTTVRNPFV